MRILVNAVRDSVKSVVVRIDVATLAIALCDAADACMKRTAGAISYPELEAFDLAAWANKMVD